MPRHKDGVWNTTTDDNHYLSDHAYQRIMVEVLLDIRDELREVRRRLQPLQCTNFLDIPRKLDRIRVGVEGVRRDRRKK